MAAPQAQEEQEESEDWMTTYADAITLLMAFFVMLLTFSKYDVPAFEEAVNAIKNQVGGYEGRSKTEELKEDVEDMVYEMQADEVVTVSTDDQGIVIELASSAFYRPGSAEIRNEALPVLKSMARTLLAPRYQLYAIEVEGHTDDDPITTRLFPSNWELSAGRATRVVRFLLAEGADSRRLKAAGYAESRPKVPNRDAQGNPIRENQAANRRVVVRVYPMSFEERERFLDLITEEDREKEERQGAPPGDAEDKETPAQPTTGTASTAAASTRE